MPLPLSILLQLSDSAFPTGAFAYSNGLEALARAGKFPDVIALESYVDAYLRQAGEFDLAFVAAAHAEANPAAFEILCLEWDATLWNHPVRKASLRQGRALLDSLSETFAHAGLKQLKQAASKTYTLHNGVPMSEWDLHFVPALGRSLGLLGASVEQACWVYLHGLIRDQMAAAMRLGLLGPRSAQAIQARALAAAETRLRDAVIPPYRDAWRTSPLVEAGQGGHGFLYSRLFQN
jgi:urease accessory protein